MMGWSMLFLFAKEGISSRQQPRSPPSARGTLPSGAAYERKSPNTKLAYRKDSIGWASLPVYVLIRAGTCRL